MGYTLRNVFFLLIFGVLAAKGLGHFAEIAKDDRGERVHRVSEQTAAREHDETYSDGDQEMVLQAGSNGHFTVAAWIDGAEIPFMIDTGASTVVLSPDDANRLGFYPSGLDYNAVFATANGEVRAALVTIRELRIGALELDDVEAAVIQAPMGMSLLGRSALERLAGYEVEGDRMILRW
jgi:aspartyl protease family protein